MIFKKTSFKKAKPIWEKGEQKTQNHTILFESFVKQAPTAVLRISGYTGYQVFINGEFVHWGPARAGRGYYRVDELSIGKYLKDKNNRISVLSTGYYTDSFEWFKEPSFICAEIEANDSIISYTSDSNWKAYLYKDKVQKVQRYSVQRTFAEVYDYRYCTDIISSTGRTLLEIEECDEKQFIEREISYPEFDYESILKLYEYGNVEHIVPTKYYDDRAIEQVDERVDGFKKEQCEYISIHMAQCLNTVKKGNEAVLPCNIGCDEYIGAEMQRNLTGFISITLDCKSNADIYLTFDELLVDDKLDFTRNLTSNVVLYRLSEGKEYRLLTSEPYTFKYLNLICVGGNVNVKNIGIIRTDFNKSEIIRKLNTEKADATISRIYAAAVETFRQNTFDIYMDCPSRERAGWLCDSFFTARVEKLLTGKSVVEKCFLSNFMMEKQHRNIPNGMLSMCYPSDFVKRPGYIPNWAMWYLLEAKEYYQRTGDKDFIADIYPNMKKLCGFFEKYENEDGLLQNLEGWIFVEWSKCNELVQDVNYPTNMLYYKFKMTLYELYGEEKYKKEAEQLRNTIRRKSRIGMFFCDNSVFNTHGELILSGEITETCQYYAFFCGVATPEEDATLWKTMVNDFGPERRSTGKWENIHYSNAFIGNYLRLELLSKAGIMDKLEQNIRGYFDYMAIRTGTLWEHDKESASCNHGFASHVLLWLDKLGYLL